MPAIRDYAFEREATPYPAGAGEYGVWLAGRAPWQLFATTTVKDFEGDAKYQAAPDKAKTLRGAVERTQSLTGFTHVGVAGAERFMRRWWRRSIQGRAYASGTIPYGVAALEYHKDRVTPHHHWLIGGLPEWLVRDVAIGKATHGASGGILWHEWYKDHGSVRLDVLSRVTEHPAMGAAIYASKYLSKDGGKFYAFGSWPRGEANDSGMEYRSTNPLYPGSGEVVMPQGDEVYERWEAMPGSRNAERVFREMCEGTWRGEW